MLPTKKQPSGCSTLCKLQPQAKLPAPAALRSLSPAEQRILRRRLVEPAECVFTTLFREADTERLLLETYPQANSAADNDDSGLDLLAPRPNRALNAEQERHMFLRLNYCRYRVMRIFNRFHEKRLTAAAARELVKWESKTTRTRSEIVRANVPLVLAMAKRTRLTGVDYADLISEGNLALLRSVDKFDADRGFKFSTYSCRAILKSFSRVASRTARYRGYFPTEYDPTLEKSDFVEQKRIDVVEDCVDELRAILGRNLADLNNVEQCVIRARFSLDAPLDVTEPHKAKTLEQVGLMIGVTKERVRQIQNKALTKLRTVLESGILSV